MVSFNDINNTILDNDFSVNRSTAGTTVSSSINQSDNTNTSSHAESLVTVGGTSGGDPFSRFNVSGTQSFTLGIDNSDSDNFKITDGASPSAGTEFLNLDTSGRFNYPLQPAFSAYRNASVNNVTGDGTSYTVIFDTEFFDIGSNFDTTTGLFSAPIDGIYIFTGSIFVQNIDNATMNVGNSSFSFTSGLHTYWGMNPANAEQGNSDLVLGGSCIRQLSAGQTAGMLIQISGGTLSVDLRGNATGQDTWFQGWLLG